MLAFIVAAAFLDSVYILPTGLIARPRSIPDRWLLKHTPANLPQLPATFFDTDWHYGFNPRSLRGAYDTWTRFVRETVTMPGEVSIVRSGRGFSDEERTVTFRHQPAAIQGPLLEYDGNLHTVAVTNWETDRTQPPRWVLNFGAAVEVRKNVWYQAGCERAVDGTVPVREYRLEFAADPRTVSEGAVKVFGSERRSTI